jgi:hypothetical protein
MKKDDKITVVIQQEAKYDRNSYMYIKNNTVYFDNSDGEYGITQFDLKLLEDKIKEHKKNNNNHLKHLYWDD